MEYIIILLMVVVGLQIILALQNENTNSFIHFKFKKIMALIDDLNTKVDQLQSDLDAKQEALATLIQSLKDQIAAGSGATTEQLQSLLDKVTATDTDLNDTPTT